MFKKSNTSSKSPEPFRLLCFKPNSNRSRIDGIIEDFLTWSWGIFSNVGHCCCRCVTWFPAVLLLDEVLFYYTSYSTLYSQSHQVVPYVQSILHKIHTQRSSTFWHSSDFNGILRVLGSFLYAIQWFGALILVQKTESMSHLLQRFVVTFHCHLHHIFFEVYGQCFHVGAIFRICRRSLKFDELTCDLCPTHEQFHDMNIFRIIQQFCNIFHIFTGYCQQTPSQQVLVANCISPVVELSYPSGDRTIWKYKLWTYFLERFLNFYRAFTLPSFNLNIDYLFVKYQRECTVHHDSFVNDVIFTWRHVKLFFPAQILHQTLMNNSAKVLLAYVKKIKKLWGSAHLFLTDPHTPLTNHTSPFFK